MPLLHSTLIKSQSLCPVMLVSNQEQRQAAWTHKEQSPVNLTHEIHRVLKLKKKKKVIGAAGCVNLFSVKMQS